MNSQKIELDEDLSIYLIWIFWKRMIIQGADGVSWVDLSSGMIGGQKILK